MKLDGVVAQKNKECGNGTMFIGGKLRPNPKRIPTGVFSVDYITAGGVPVHGSACFWGGDGAGKTYLAIHLMKMASLLCWRCFEFIEFCTCSQKPLIMKSSWIDVEGTLERDWIGIIGVPGDSFYVSLADYGEQGIDLADASLSADDCGLVIIDSLGALVPLREFNNDTEDTNMGVGASIVTKAVKRLKQRMIRERKRGHPCAVIFVNQMRAILGQQFGSKEGQAGGFAMKHEFSLLLRCGKNVLDKKKDAKYIEDDREKDLASKHSVIIKKEKVFTLARSAMFTVVKEKIPVLSLDAGQVDDMKIVLTYAKQYKILGGGGKKWYLFDKEYASLKNIQDYLKNNIQVYYMLQKKIIEEATNLVRGV